MIYSSNDYTMKQLLNSFILLISALIIGAFVLPIGFVYDLFWSMYKANFVKFFKRFFRVINQIIIVIASIIEQVAIGIDQVGNVMAGEFIEDCITAEENTTFRESGITISASTGKLESEGKLNDVGTWFTKTLSKVFGKDHSILAYKRWLRNNQPLD